MEDRHYLSEPRPLAGLELPTWEVDIMREGVDTPIMTLTVDNNILPPRKRKKKIVWKLPEDLGIAPKFGMEDKKRILEIFKQKKKELKRQRKSQTSTNGVQNGDNDIGDSNPKTLVRKNSSVVSDDGSGPNEDSLPNGNGHSNSPPPPGFGVSRLSLSAGDRNSPSPTNSTHRSSLAQESKIKEPPFIGSSIRRESSGQPSQTPHVMTPLPSSAAVQQSPYSELPSRQKPLSNPPPAPSQPEQQQRPHNMPPGISPSKPSSTPASPPGIDNAGPPPRQFSLPENSVMSLAEFVAKSYYLLLANGMIDELCQYYTPTAQKSMTVGGGSCLLQPTSRTSDSTPSSGCNGNQHEGILAAADSPWIDAHIDHRNVCATTQSGTSTILPFARVGSRSFWWFSNPKRCPCFPNERRVKCRYGGFGIGRSLCER